MPKSGEMEPGLRGKGLGEIPGCSVVLLRGFAGVEWPRRGALLWAGARRRLGLGDAGVRGREQEITGRFKEPGPRISASGIGRKGCGDRGRGSRPVCCARLLCERRARGRRWP